MQKGNILPSERAFAFKLKLEATKGQGVRTDLPRVDKIVAEQAGSSRNKLQRYIHLTGLISEILSMVDEKKIAINPAVELPYLKKDEQTDLLEIMEMWYRLLSYFYRYSY